MHDALRSAKPWFTFAGAVLVVAVLYWAQAVIVPVALAMLLTFVLSPAVVPLQRRIGGVAAVLLVVVVTFGTFGLAGWAVTTQLRSLVQQLPTYQQNIKQKIRDVRWLGRGQAVDTVQATVQDIQSEIAEGETSGTPAKPVVVETAPVASLWGLPTTVGPWLEPFATAALVMILVIFMLLERQDLRNRLISLFGHRHLTVTTRAFDEAGRRVSRYLVVQALINLFVGTCVGVGLYVIGVPYAILWAALAATLRFVPYFGPWIAAIAPIVVSLAAFDGLTRPMLVLVLYGGLELFTSFVVESFFFAGAAGVSQVGLLVAIAFWTWLWGPLGLLMATPLTVCLVVIGKYVPGVEFVATLLADNVTLESDVSYYQRLLAGDYAEAAELIEQHVKDGSAETIYDAILVPALNYAERDRIEGRLSTAEEQAIVDASRDLLEDAAVRLNGTSSGEDGGPAMPAARPIGVLGWPAHGAPDALALQMLDVLLTGTPFALETLSSPGLFGDGVRMLKERNCQIVCIADLPPSEPAKSRHLVKRLRAAVPELTILVGRWAPPPFADESGAILQEAGANYISTTLIETREQLTGLPVEAPPSAVANPDDRRLNPVAAGHRV
jgi:predicted PurR-regulated permease PerM